jgi:manganese transport protein
MQDNNSSIIGTNPKSLEDVHKSIVIPAQGSLFAKLLAFSGPGYLVAVGYMDPGNWATDLAGGSKFGYSLLIVIFLSNLMAIVLQYLAIKLGVAAQKDLAQACRDYYSKPVSIALWLLAEIAIIACDLAEVIGSAIGLNLLFSIPLSIGVFITAFDVLLLLMIQHKGFRYLETLIVILIGLIMLCFGVIIRLAKPSLAAVMEGFLPTPEILLNQEMLYLAIGIIGATVMPHNLYLHSAVVQTRRHQDSFTHTKEAIFFNTIDSTIALTLAFLVNAAILIVSAAVFHTNGMHHVAEIQDAYQLFTPLLNTHFASLVFAIALLISGQNSTITGTLAGQIIMEGFMHIQLKPWVRRLISRGLTIIPASLAILFFGQHGLAQLLLISQVILSLQLPFAIFPLIQFTNNEAIMGYHYNAPITKICAFTIGGIITFLNIWLLYLLL